MRDARLPTVRDESARPDREVRAPPYGWEANRPGRHAKAAPATRGDTTAPRGSWLDTAATMYRRHRTVALAVALLAPAALISACGGTGDGAPRPSEPAALSRCASLPGLPSARCGTVEVPLDRTNPGAGTTRVAFALVPHHNRSAPSLGTLVFNPGGPGDPTIGAAADTAKMFAPLLDRRDLLLIDPRGTGRSDPLRCGAFQRNALADVFASRARLTALVGACGRELGRRAAFYGTTAVADDFDAVRAALRLDRLDLWGNSYGTYLMPVYAARHPTHVRSMVLSGLPDRLRPVGA